MTYQCHMVFSVIMLQFSEAQRTVAHDVKYKLNLTNVKSRLPLYFYRKKKSKLIGEI